MNHETLQALYSLDVAEVGEVKAAKRWEYYTGFVWDCMGIAAPSFSPDIAYRRKPDLPWPKVMAQNTTQVWPADAPEWANYMVTDADGQHKLYGYKPEPDEESKSWHLKNGTRQNYNSACPNWRDSLIERPKPAVKKIDWSKLRQNIRALWRWFHPNCLETTDFPSPWIAWNCDENTRGNPLPDGLVVEWYGVSVIAKQICTPVWNVVTRFRIVGIQEGWE
jgi:hypothetical protein